MEHLFLHILIGEGVLSGQFEKTDEIVGIGGIVSYIVPELNDLYSGWETREIWRKNCHNQVKNDKEVYLLLLKRFKNSCDTYPTYSETCLFSCFNEMFGVWSKKQNKKIFDEIKLL